VVLVGATVVEVPVTVPTPLIDSVVASVTDQLKVVEAPTVIVVGEALNDVMVGALLGGVLVTEPELPPPHAINVRLAQSIVAN
jgi:hypothetical protein